MEVGNSGITDSAGGAPPHMQSRFVEPSTPVRWQGLDGKHEFESFTPTTPPFFFDSLFRSPAQRNKWDGGGGNGEKGTYYRYESVSVEEKSDEAVRMRRKQSEDAGTPRNPGCAAEGMGGSGKEKVLEREMVKGSCVEKLVQGVETSLGWVLGTDGGFGRSKLSVAIETV